MGFTKIFLQAKHWQLFLLTFAVPMIFQFIVMGIMFVQLVQSHNPDPFFMFGFFKFFPVIMILYMGALFGWFWSVGIGLQNKVPANVKMKTGKFKIFFFIPLVYIVLLSLAMGAFFNNFPAMIENDADPRRIAALIGTSLVFIIPLHLFSMFCIFYTMYFVAKTFKTVQLQRETTFSDFAGEFFLIWFYFVGIWIIQPKINKMAEAIDN